MKIKSNFRKDSLLEGGKHMYREQGSTGRHIPPHERKALMSIEFEESDWLILKEVFDDEDTVFAAAEIINNAPPEIQILALQIINIIKEVK